MIWQDIVLAGGSLLFTVALIPSIRSKHKPALTTSVLTGSVLLLFTFTYATLELWFSAVSVCVNGLMWLTLALQKYRQVDKI